MIGNWIAFSFSVLELLFFAGVAFGFGFLQFVFEEEDVFWDELCHDTENCTTQGSSLICLEEKEPCEAQYEQYSNIFTWFLLTSNLAALVLDPIHKKFGTFVLRLILGTLTTSGIVFLVFYQESPYFIWPAWQLIGIPALMYVILNTKEICANFPALKSMMIGLINGIFGASAGIFLIFKMLYQSDLQLQLKDMLIVYACLSSIIWIKTFFFSPILFVELNLDGTYSIFQSSFIGRCFNRGKVEENQLTQESNVQGENKIQKMQDKVEETTDSVWKYAFSPKLLIYVLFYTCLTVRINTFPSWALPWFQWTFSTMEPEEAEKNVSLCMDIYGFTYYLALVVAPMPGLFIGKMQKVFKSNILGEHHSLTVMFTLAVFLSTLMSIQMCFQGSVANAAIVTALVSIYRTLFFISRGIFLYMQFPREHFGTLYSMSLVPSAACQYVISPLFDLILNGDDIADADFVPVSIGFAAVSLASIYMPLYNHFVLTKQLNLEEENDPTNSQKKHKDSLDAISLGVTTDL